MLKASKRLICIEGEKWKTTMTQLMKNFLKGVIKANNFCPAFIPSKSYLFSCFTTNWFWLGVTGALESQYIKAGKKIITTMEHTELRVSIHVSK